MTSTTADVGVVEGEVEDGEFDTGTGKPLDEKLYAAMASALGLGGRCGVVYRFSPYRS